MNYSTLVADRATSGSIMSAINYSRIDPDAILDEAEAWIYAKLRVRQMKTSATVPILSGASTASFPSGYLDPIQFAIPGHCSRLRRWDEERFRSHLGWDENGILPTGLPTVWSDFDDLIQLNTLADQDYSGLMVFYKTPAGLAADNQTNWLTTKYPTLLRRACLMFAAEERKEYDTRDRAEGDALKQIEDIKVESDEAMRGIELDFNWDSNE